MSRPTYHVEPQRSDGRSYVPCELHRATSFAVVKTTKWTSRGQKFTARSVISRHDTKTGAEYEASVRTKNMKPSKGYKLGRRITKESVL